MRAYRSHRVGGSKLSRRKNQHAENTSTGYPEGSFIFGTADRVYMVQSDGSWKLLPLTHAQFAQYRQALEKYADAKAKAKAQSATGGVTGGQIQDILR